MDSFFQDPVWWDSWRSLLRIALLSFTGYVCLLIILRASGKRTLSKMNAFDFVVTIALGSAFATILLSPSTTLSEGVVALFMLVWLQYSVAWLSVRSRRFENLLKAQPTLLFYNGDMLHKAMKQERFTEEEVLAAIRTAGQRDIADIAAVVLESDGSVQVLPKRENVQRDVLSGSALDLP